MRGRDFALMVLASVAAGILVNVSLALLEQKRGRPLIAPSSPTNLEPVVPGYGSV